MLADAPKVKKSIKQAKEFESDEELASWFGM